MASLVPSPHLIQDLECLVFTFAYRFNPASLSDLLLVCHRVRDWLEPYRFQFIQLRVENTPKILQLLSQKPPPFVSTHVLSILDNCGNWPPRDAILKMCTGIKYLQLTFEWEVPATYLPDLSQFPRLRRLIIDGINKPFTHKVCGGDPPSLRSLTHLHWAWGEMWESREFPPLAQMIQRLPALTHFSIQWDYRKPFWDGISELTHLDQLKVVGIVRYLDNFSLTMDSERIPIEWMSVLGEKKVVLIGLDENESDEDEEVETWWDPEEYFAEYWALMPAETPTKAQKKPGWLERFTNYP
ncbi:hypothetical protein DL96DRAFT_1595839 [Flagelloscypha sp. PMI_526]|nr:hypothetical protein DL96DRAFT_1595839 [Flagelloscypha sp. PMI_526]